MINTYITELVNYAIRSGLITEDDRVYSVNRLLADLGLVEYVEPQEELAVRPLEDILKDMAALRSAVDAAEAMIPDKYLPYPTYGAMLFSVR